MLKSPICTIFGHVDAGKTSLMDVLRHTNIAEKENGGITQDIKSYFVNIDTISQLTHKITNKYKIEPKIPGILLIDTPGHKVFNKLRNFGSNLCDIAIVVIDIISGVKPQTVESIKILQEYKIPFIIVATKLDMIDGYKSYNMSSLNDEFVKQDSYVLKSINGYIHSIKYDLEEVNIKSELYFKNKKPTKIYSIVPISNKTNSGLSDLLCLLVYISQEWMNSKMIYDENKSDIIIMKSYNDTKMGWVIDVIIKNGNIKIGEKYIILSIKGPQEIKIRNLIIGKNRVKEAKASNNVTIIAANCRQCYCGTQLFPITTNIIELQKEYDTLLNSYKLNNKGILLIAPTLPMLDGLYNIFKDENICNVDIGNINKNSIRKNLNKFENITEKEYRCILYFGELSSHQYSELYNYCKSLNLYFIKEPVIYHLKETYDEYKNNVIKERQYDQIIKGDAVYPCKLRIIKKHIFMKGGNQHLMFGARIEEGQILKGTLLRLNKELSEKEPQLGSIISMQKNNEDVEYGKQNDEICIRMDNPNGLLYNRHFDYKDILYSNITRESIDILKKDYRDKMVKKDWLLVIELKKIFNIL
jgi:translation initiation factor 5B